MEMVGGVMSKQQVVHQFCGNLPNEPFLQRSCLEFVAVINASVQKLRDLTDAKHFCHWETQPKLLKLLKKAFFEPINSGQPSLCDCILSMDEGFEFQLRQRGQQAALECSWSIYNLCTGRVFAPSYETDTELFERLVQVEASTAEFNGRAKRPVCCCHMEKRATFALCCTVSKTLLRTTFD